MSDRPFPLTPSEREANARRQARTPADGARLAVLIVLVAINLRPAAAVIGPLIPAIRRSTGLSSIAAGTLSTLPVLCFGALAPLAPVLAARLGIEAALTGSLALLGGGLALTLSGSVALLFAGMLLAGAAIAVGNVLLPVLVRQRMAHRAGLITGLYTTALTGFAALAAGLAVPAAHALGGWRQAIALWAGPAVLAMAAWLALARGLGGRRADAHAQSTASSASARAPIRLLLRDRVAWSVTLLFALQSGGFYATLAWLPSVFESHGIGESEGGLLLSLSLLVGLLAALMVPQLATRMADQRPLVLACLACTAGGLGGLLAAPVSAAYLWVILIGLGQNGTFPLVITLIVLRGGSLRGTAALSTLSQTVGYLLAAAAPVTVGAVHQLTGSWSAAVALLLGLLAPQALAGLAAGRDRTVSPPADPPDHAESQHAIQQRRKRP